NQREVHTHTESFSHALRAALREDPDVIMVGEMRDKETVAMGLRAAMTGHLVLTTLHTNDAISSVLRLKDMGAENYITAATLQGVIAQRLVKRLCEYCKAPYVMTDDDKKWIEVLSSSKIDEKNSVFYQGVGCAHCHHTGFQGRIGVYELLIIDEAMVIALKNNQYNEFTRLAQQSRYYIPLQEAVLSYALEGVTSLDEVLRVITSVNESQFY
ncbi:MAG: ATPase, T2SS/T4P/T4SS family, partial [Pseudomonadota bacterium]